MSKICSKCGYSSSDDQHFCQMCGNDLDQSNNVCKNCGNVLNLGDTFCTNCGTQVNLSSQPTTNQSTDNSVPNSSSNIGDTIKMSSVDNNMAEYDNNQTKDINSIDSNQDNFNDTNPTMAQQPNSMNQFNNTNPTMGQQPNGMNQFNNTNPNIGQQPNDMNQFNMQNPNLGQTFNSNNQFNPNQSNMRQPDNMNQFNMNNPNLNNNQSSNVINGSNKLPKIIIGAVAGVLILVVLILVIVSFSSSSSVPAEETMTTFCDNFNDENYEKALKNYTNIQEYSKANYKKEKFKSPDEMSEAIYEYFDDLRNEFDKATMKVEKVEKVSESDDSAVYNVTLNLSYETKSGDSNSTTKTGEIHFKKVNDNWVIDLDSLSMFD